MYTYFLKKYDYVKLGNFYLKNVKFLFLLSIYESNETVKFAHLSVKTACLSENNYFLQKFIMVYIQDSQWHLLVWSYNTQ